MNSFTIAYLKENLQRFVGVAKSCMVEITIMPVEIDNFDFAKKYCAQKGCGTAGRLREVNEEYVIVYYDNSSIERSYIPIENILINDGKLV